MSYLKRSLLVVLVAAVFVAILPTVVFADPGNGKAKGHSRSATTEVVEPKNGKPTNPGNGNSAKGNDPNKMGPAGGGSNPTPTPTPTPMPTKGNGAIVDKWTYHGSDSLVYGDIRHWWDYTIKFRNIVSSGNKVNFFYSSKGTYGGINIHTEQVLYEGSHDQTLHVQWDKRTGERTLMKDTYSWDEIWYGIRHQYRVQYELGPYGVPVVKHLWVDGVKVY